MLSVRSSFVLLDKFGHTRRVPCVTIKSKHFNEFSKGAIFSMQHGCNTSPRVVLRLCQTGSSIDFSRLAAGSGRMDGPPLRKFALAGDVANSRRATPFGPQRSLLLTQIPIPYLIPPHQAVRLSVMIMVSASRTGSTQGGACSDPSRQQIGYAEPPPRCLSVH
jgi:hypothetical protein